MTPLPRRHDDKGQSIAALPRADCLCQLCCLCCLF